MSVFMHLYIYVAITKKKRSSIGEGVVGDIRGWREEREVGKQAV